MLMMRIGLLAASVAFAFTTWASWDAGFPPELALLRGGLAFMAASFVAYLGELVIATAPPAPPRTAVEVPANTASPPNPSQDEAARDGADASVDAPAASGWNERQAA
ncbi:MAG: hypothetical protein GEU80_04235 [Dehalococcoidia bacterium]|nr:hypothetical protein [Dehalococcoidia bacterium]